MAVVKWDHGVSYTEKSYLETKKISTGILIALRSSGIRIIMAALRSRCGHYIFAQWFLLLSFILLFLA